MEMAMPERLMMFEEIPTRYIGMKARSTETGIVMIGTNADGKCQRKKRMTTLTMSSSAQSEPFRLEIDLRMSSERS